MRAALYARVSTAAQAGEEKVSLPTQIEDMKVYCQDKGYQVVGEYIDAGYSGSTKNRPEFQRMLRDAEAGNFDIILCWKSDRLSRGMYPAAALLDVIEPRDIKLEAVKENISLDTFSMYAVVGRIEINNMKERMRMGKIGKARQGKRSGGRIPFGYDSAPGGELVINPDEAKVITSLFESIAGGMTLRAWCKLANQQGIATKIGGKWASDMASRMCHDTKYIGKGKYGKEGKGDVIPMPYPQIISDKLFSEVQSRLRINRAKSSCTSKNIYPLSKLGKCHCGAPLSCRTSKGYQYIMCTQQQDKPDIYHCYQPAYWRLGPVEDMIWGEIEDVLDSYRKDVNGVLLDNFEKAKASVNDTIENKEAELKRCAEEKQRLIRQVQNGVFTDTEVKLTMSNIREREEHWQNELTNAQALQRDSGKIWNDFMESLKAVDEFYDWGGTWFLSNEQKKSILNTLVEEFILSPSGEIEIRYKLPVTEKQLQDTVAGMLSVD